MTTADLRTYFTDTPLPPDLRPAPWIHITDVPRFVALHLERLDCEAPILRRLAEKNLKALHKSLTA